MKVYSSEEEQIEALKNWFKKNGTTLILAITLSLTSILGYKYWQNKNVSYLEQASVLYEELQSSVDASKQEEVANNLYENYKSTVYGKVAALYLTNKKVTEKKWADAEKDYKWLFQETSKWPELKVIVFENWIRAQLEQDKVADAYKNLEEVALTENYAKSFPLNYYNLKGDVLAKQNKNSEAIDAYNQALSSASFNPSLYQQTAQFVNWVTLKRNDLLEAKPLK